MHERAVSLTNPSLCSRVSIPSGPKSIHDEEFPTSLPNRGCLGTLVCTESQTALPTSKKVRKVVEKLHAIMIPGRKMAKTLGESRTACSIDSCIVDERKTIFFCRTSQFGRVTLCDISGNIVTCDKSQSRSQLVCFLFEATWGILPDRHPQELPGA
jgi:hypothetical protein